MIQQRLINLFFHSFFISGHEEHAWNQLFQNVNVPAATMAILTTFVKVLVMKNKSEIHFSKCKCPGGYDGDCHDFMINMIFMIFVNDLVTKMCSKSLFLIDMMTILTIWQLFYISRIKVFITQQLNLCRRDTRYGYSEFSKKFWNMPKQRIF